MAINFGKRSQSKPVEKELDPCLIYEKLDRHASKGPLRKPVQEAVLTDWFNNYRQKRDVILKLPTGEGKTIVGLLLLQSKLNEGKSPCLYICPNNYLVDQVKSQATEFGVPFCEIKNDELPDEFVSGEKILITNAQMLFNGRSTKFGIGSKSINVATILLDDAHSCIETIKSACRFTIKKNSGCYAELLALFSESLKTQGSGTFADIENGETGAQITVPYWDWQNKHDDVVKVLSKFNQAKDQCIWFSWELLKDGLSNCICIFSGSEIEISSYALPLEKFGGFFNATHRIFMSATISDDSFFIRDLGLDKEAVEHPLTYEKKWSGEKMILIPSMIGEELTRDDIINWLGKAKDTAFGIVALVPSFAHAAIWEACGSIAVRSDNLNAHIENSKNGKFPAPLVMASRYDGVDLPDAMCRVLIIDSRPINETLLERYVEKCIPDSTYLKIKMAQTIEQGLGRAVRSEKDFAVVIFIGRDLVKQIRYKDSRQFFSVQTRKQIEIGLDLAKFAKEDRKEGQNDIETVRAVMNQCLQRDEGWKNYYAEQMNQISDDKVTQKRVDELMTLEKEAESLYVRGRALEAHTTIQKLLDKFGPSLLQEERGWYMQMMARYLYQVDRAKSMALQIEAHKINRSLLLPPTGYEVLRISLTSQDRIRNIRTRVSKFETFENLLVYIDDVLSRLSFGSDSEKFEKAVDDLGQLLGYETERPDKNWKSGPDNLWALREGEYLFIECKNEVSENRACIEKGETGQFNNNIAWYHRYYAGNKTHYAMIIPTKKINVNTGFNEHVRVMRKGSLRSLKSKFRAFVLSFKTIDLKDISGEFINQSLTQHELTTDNIVANYFEDTVQQR
ncbi:MAG: DEAD/DEAH box helicase family protein [Bdellovibrionales bacterium]|nr:DEAD/DEAH box helicase family protein [Bdellovibrionales bacterium]